ncbi:MAG TPA: PorV/PorQ family protein, partial [Chitinophagaceae bacterium]|nr:PorV/PorQ family protein [Chitinophagaceae bacterium]
MIRYFLAAFFCITFSKPHAQTLGGNAGYNFLNLPSGTNLTAAGGVNVSHAFPDISVALSNPALLTEKVNGQAGLNFLRGIAGVNGYTLAGGYFNKDWNTTFGAQVSYFDYGQIDQSDAAGNRIGRFHATDYVVQVSAGKRYLQKWQYGGSLKFIQSHYPPFSSTAIALDIGLHYTDSLHGFNVGLLAKNMGAAIKSYAGTGDELP